MVFRARLTMATAAMALAVVALLWLATPGARAQDGEPPRDEPSPAEVLCTPASDRDPMPAVVERKLGLYYGTATAGAQVAATGVDTTALIPQELADLIIAAIPDVTIADGLPRRVSPSLDVVMWVTTEAPFEDAAANLVRFWGTQLAKDATVKAADPIERGTLYFKIAEWETSSGGFIPVLTPTCGVAAVTFSIVTGDVTLPDDGDVDPDIFPPTPTPRPIAVYDPGLPVTRPSTPPQAPGSSATATPVRTIAGSPGLTPTPRVNDDDVAGVITGPATATPRPLPTPRPPATGAGEQPTGASPLLFVAVALMSGSAMLLAASRRRG